MACYLINSNSRNSEQQQHKLPSIFAMTQDLNSRIHEQCRERGFTGVFDVPSPENLQMVFRLADLDLDMDPDIFGGETADVCAWPTTVSVGGCTFATKSTSLQSAAAVPTMVTPASL